MMSVFEQSHQDGIDQINDAGWRYLAGRINEINQEFGSHGGVIGSAIAIQVKGVEVWIEQGEPELEWRLVRPDGRASQTDLDCPLERTLRALPIA